MGPRVSAELCSACPRGVLAQAGRRTGVVNGFWEGCAPPRLTLLSPVAQGCPSGLALRAEGSGVHNQGESRGGTPSSSQIWQMGGRSIR